MSNQLRDQAPNLDEIVAKLEVEGFRFSRLKLEVEDPCRPIDVEWNYKDMVHVGHIHSHMSRQFMYIGKSAYTSFDLQKILGITIPQSASFYVTHDNRIIVNTVLFLYVIIVEIRYEAIGDLQTRTSTSYAIGARSSLLRLFMPILHKVIERNWRQFTKDDRPLRARRGQLRKSGYEFCDVSPIDHRETLRVTGKGVDTPAARPGYRCELRLGGTAAATQYIGADDHLGLQVHIDEDTVRLFPRLCPHRGALLDAKTIQAGPGGGLIECPWHGRKFRALASISRDGGVQRFEGSFHRCTQDNGVLTIETKETPQTPDADWTEVWSKI